MGTDYQVRFLTLHPQFSEGMIPVQRLRILGPNREPSHFINIGIDPARFGIVGGLMQCPGVPGNGDPPFRKIGYPPPDPPVPHIRLRKLEYKLRWLEGRDHCLSCLDLGAIGKPYSSCTPVLNQDLFHLLPNIALSSILNKALIGSMGRGMGSSVSAAHFNRKHQDDKKGDPSPVEIGWKPIIAVGEPE